jgi:hypothetical protein
VAIHVVMPAEPDGFTLNDEEVAKLAHFRKVCAVARGNFGSLGLTPRREVTGSASKGGTGRFQPLSEGPEGIERLLEALAGPSERLCPRLLEFRLDGVDH